MQVATTNFCPIGSAVLTLIGYNDKLNLDAPSGSPRDMHGTPHNIT